VKPSFIVFIVVLKKKVGYGKTIDVGTYLKKGIFQGPQILDNKH
jgi:hypothetical protein